MALPWDAKFVVGILAVSGVVHLARPETYEPLMPAFVPRHREVIYASGVAELLCAAGLLSPRTRRVAGYASAALLVVVFPGNVKMADDARRSRSTRFKTIAYARLPHAVADGPGRPQGSPDHRLTVRGRAWARGRSRGCTARPCSERWPPGCLPLDSISSLVGVSHQMRPNHPLIE